MTWIDYTIVGIVGASMAISVIRGFVRELFSIASWIAAFFVGFQFSESFAANLAPWIQSDTFRHILAFMLLFSCTLLVGSGVSHFIVSMLRKTGFGITDRIIGVFFGFARGVLLVTVMLMIGSFTELTVASPWANSALIPSLDPLTKSLMQFMPDDINKKIKKETKKSDKEQKKEESATSLLPLKLLTKEKN